MRFSPTGSIWFGCVTLAKRPLFFAGAAVILIAMSMVAAVSSGFADMATIGLSEQFPWIGYLVYEDFFAKIVRLWSEPGELEKGSVEWTVPGDLTDWALTNYVSMGAVALYLSAQDNVRAAKLSAIWAPHPYWSFLAVSALTAVSVVLGAMILFVPGVIALVLFCFSPFVVIDKGLGPIEAMKESARISSGQRWRVFALFLLCLLIWVVFAVLVLGALALAVVLLIQNESLTEWASPMFWFCGVLVGIGMLVLIAVGGLAFAHAYRQLSRSAQPVPLQAT
ncbi:MAG: YciC family protein [Pseudomonadota bacterium]